MGVLRILPMVVNAAAQECRFGNPVRGLGEGQRLLVEHREVRIVVEYARGSGVFRAHPFQRTRPIDLFEPEERIRGIEGRLLFSAGAGSRGDQSRREQQDQAGTERNKGGSTHFDGSRGRKGGQ